MVYTDIISRKLDERLGTFMMGAVSVMLLLNNQYLWFLLYFVIIIVVMGYIKQYTRKYLGDGDITTLAWIIPALIILKKLPPNLIRNRL
jgi:hypothetical protein